MKCMFTQVTQCVSHNMANSRQICSAGICSLSSDVGEEEAIQQRLVILYNLCNPYCLHCDAVCAFCNLRACRNSQCDLWYSDTLGKYDHFHLMPKLTDILFIKQKCFKANLGRYHHICKPPHQQTPMNHQSGENALLTDSGRDK